MAGPKGLRGWAQGSGWESRAARGPGLLRAALGPWAQALGPGPSALLAWPSVAMYWPRLGAFPGIWKIKKQVLEKKNATKNKRKQHLDLVLLHVGRSTNRKLSVCLLFEADPYKISAWLGCVLRVQRASMAAMPYDIVCFTLAAFPLEKNSIILDKNTRSYSINDKKR